MGYDRKLVRGLVRGRPARLILVVSVLASCTVISAGCGADDPQDTARSDAGGERSSIDVAPLAGENVVTSGTASIKYRSPEGMFAVTWPAGCNVLRTRKPADAPPDSVFPGEAPTQLSVYCDRAGHQSEGCAVRGFYNETAEGGGPPHPRMVIAQIESTMTTYGVDVTSQTPGSWGPLQGVDVRCGERNGSGELWIRGLLAGPHYYLLVAWSQSGALFEDPVYQTFFASFRLLEPDGREP